MSISKKQYLVSVIISILVIWSCINYPVNHREEIDHKETELLLEKQKNIEDKISFLFGNFKEKSQLQESSPSEAQKKEEIIEDDLSHPIQTRDKIFIHVEENKVEEDYSKPLSLSDFLKRDLISKEKKRRLWESISSDFKTDSDEESDRFFEKSVRKTQHQRDDLLFPFHTEIDPSYLSWIEKEQTLSRVNWRPRVQGIRGKEYLFNNGVQNGTSFHLTFVYKGQDFHVCLLDLFKNCVLMIQYTPIDGRWHHGNVGTIDRDNKYFVEKLFAVHKLSLNLGETVNMDIYVFERGYVTCINKQVIQNFYFRGDGITNEVYYLLIDCFGNRCINIELEVSELPDERIYKIEENFEEITFPVANVEVLQPEKIEYFISIPSAPHNFDLRQAIRSSWLRDELILSGKAVAKFIVGGTESSGLSEIVKKEAHAYGDIIIYEHIDSFGSLIDKLMLAIDYMESLSYKPRFFIKTDDDSYLNMTRLDNVVQKYNNSDELIYMGHMVSNVIVDRIEDSKFYVSSNHYDQKLYPIYAISPGYVFSYRMAIEMKKHYNISQVSLGIEDVTIGLWAQSMALTFGSSFKYVSLPQLNSKECKADSIVLNYMNPDLLTCVHNKMLANITPCCLSLFF